MLSNSALSGSVNAASVVVCEGVPKSVGENSTVHAIK